MRKQRGFMLQDVVIGLGLTVALMSVLAVSIKSRQDAAYRLSQRRAAIRQAESVLLQLQSGESIDDQPVRLHAIDHPSAVKNMKWVRVEVDYADNAVRLVGLVPSDCKLQIAN